MVTRQLVMLTMIGTLVCAGCAVDSPIVSQRGYLKSMALNDAATRQIQETGFYIAKNEPLVPRQDDSELKQSLQDWQNNQHQAALVAVVSQENGQWALKQIVHHQSAYAVNNASCSVDCQTTQNASDNGKVSRLTMK